LIRRCRSKGGDEGESARVKEAEFTWGNWVDGGIEGKKVKKRLSATTEQRQRF